MSKKDLREEAIKKGLEELRYSGIETENISAGSVGLLTAQLGRGHGTDLAVVFLLGRIADPAALEFLTSLEKRAADKE
ncbi:MAG: hypothetical protein AAB279_06910, partial [Candidatus Binatota bacterium]